MKYNDSEEDAMLKKALTSTLKGFINFCEQHNLRYYAAFGTAIGAVRHHGIIPWDDDIDVYMPREDYNKFLSLRGTLENSEYEIVDIENKGYYLYFAKWCQRNSTLIEKLGEPALGIYVDIFPLDFYDEKYCEPLIRHNELYRYLWLIYGHGSRKYSFADFCSGLRLIRKGKFGRVVSILLDTSVLKLLRLPSHFLIRKFMKRLEEAPKSSYCWCYSIISCESKPMPADWFGKGIKMQFEDVDILMPSNYDEYLTCMYGDYMTPPPVEKRPSSHARYFIDFNHRYSVEEVHKLKKKNALFNVLY
jgi:LicD family protein